MPQTSHILCLSYPINHLLFLINFNSNHLEIKQKFYFNVRPNQNPKAQKLIWANHFVLIVYEEKLQCHKLICTALNASAKAPLFILLYKIFKYLNISFPFFWKEKLLYQFRQLFLKIFYFKLHFSFGFEIPHCNLPVLQIPFSDYDGIFYLF